MTVQKEGPNKGRTFYCCAKPREQQCGFFQWADEDPNQGRGSNSSRGGRGGFSRGKFCVYKRLGLFCNYEKRNNKKTLFGWGCQCIATLENVCYRIKFPH